MWGGSIVSCLANLPFGWVEATLGELGIGKTENIIPADFSDEIFELWSVPAFPTGMPELLTGSEIGSNKQRVQPGDVLLCKINPRINRVWKVGQKTKYTQIASTEWIVLRIPEVESDFLVYRFREQNFRNALCADVSGVGGSLIRARPQSVEKLQITLPPLNEQRRMVAKIEALNARSQRVKEELEAIAPLLDQFRQSVLAAAFRGDLTADWREKNPDVEPASVLLERIRAERRQKDPEPLNISKFPELPDGWVWVSLEEIATHKSGIAFKSQEFTKEGIQVIRLGNVYKGRLDLDRDPVFLPEEYLANNCTLKTGDIIVSQTGTRFKRDYGNFVFISDSCPKLFLNQRLLSISCHDLIIPEYVVFASKLKFYQDHFFSHETGGVNQGNVGVTGVMRGAIPLAPQKEAKVLVSRVKAAFEYINTLQLSLDQAGDNLESLDRSILAKAFRGELVPQDPNDEPASVLLERIRAEREKLDTKKKAKGKTEKKSGQAKPEAAEPKQLSLPGFE
jgi:type I restriction enzyme S subunit